MIGKLCLHTTLSHEESPGFQDSPTLLGHWKLRSRLLCTSKRDPLPSNSLATLQITFCNLFFFNTKNLIPALDSFIVISCTVECTLLVNEQIVIRLKNKTEQYKTEGDAPVLKQWQCPLPFPQKKCTDGTSWNDWMCYSNSYYSILQIKNFKCKWVHES